MLRVGPAEPRRCALGRPERGGGGAGIFMHRILRLNSMGTLNYLSLAVGTSKVTLL